MPQSLKHLGVMAFIWVHFWVLLSILLFVVTFFVNSATDGVDSSLLLSMIWISALAMAGSLVVTWRVARRFRTWLLAEGEEEKKKSAVYLCLVLSAATIAVMLYNN